MNTSRLDPNNWLGKKSKDVVSYLLNEFGVEEFFYRAYIRKSEDHLDREIPAINLDDLDIVVKKYKEIDPRYLISFESKVLVNGRYVHFPMIDFSNSIIPEINMENVKRVLRNIGEQEGFILHSGRCFHYYGNRLMEEEEWNTFTENCKKYPEIGENYPARQLGRGKSSLRLSTGERRPKEPEVVAIYIK